MKSSIVKKQFSSLWDGLNPHLIAKFFVVKKNQQNSWIKVSDIEVLAPLLETNIEISLGWQSPFENVNSDNSAPTLAAMLQTAEFAPFLKATGMQNTTASNFATTFEGRTGLTKLNSTQVFHGAPPVKINTTAVFRALSNAKNEVEEPLNQLIKWALPVQIQAVGGITTRTIEGVKHLTSEHSASLQDVVMPSTAPVKIGMTYKGRTFSPLVIENIGVPLNAPIDKDGNFVQISVPLTLCTLTAIDRDDWTNTQII